MDKQVAKLIAQLQKPATELACLKAEISVQEEELREKWYEINRAISEQFTAIGYLPQGSVTINRDGPEFPSVLTFKGRDMVFAPGHLESGLFDSIVVYNPVRSFKIEKAPIRLLAYGMPEIPELLRQAIRSMKRAVGDQQITLWASQNAIRQAGRILSRLG